MFSEKNVGGSAWCGSIVCFCGNYFLLPGQMMADFFEDSPGMTAFLFYVQINSAVLYYILGAAVTVGIKFLSLEMKVNKPTFRLCDS